MSSRRQDGIARRCGQELENAMRKFSRREPFLPDRDDRAESRIPTWNASISSMARGA